MSTHDKHCEADWGPEGQESPCRCAERAQTLANVIQQIRDEATGLYVGDIHPRDQKTLQYWEEKIREAVEEDRSIEYGILRVYGFPSYSEKLVGSYSTEERAESNLQWYGTGHVIKQRRRGIEPGPWERTPKQIAAYEEREARLEARES